MIQIANQLGVNDTLQKYFEWRRGGESRSYKSTSNSGICYVMLCFCLCNNACVWIGVLAFIKRYGDFQKDKQAIW